MSEPVLVVRDTARAAVLLQPIRLRILEQLAEPASAVALAGKLRLPRQVVNYHLHALQSRKLIALLKRRRKGSVVERIYRRTAESYAISIEAIGNVGSLPQRVADRFSSAYQIAHASRVVADLGALREGAAEAGQTLPTFLLEVDVAFASAEARNAFTAELAEFIAQQVEKHHDPTPAKSRTFHYYLGSYPKRKVPI